MPRHDPTTSLDPRFSGPDVSAIDWAAEHRHPERARRRDLWSCWAEIKQVRRQDGEWRLRRHGSGPASAHRRFSAAS